MPLQHQPTLENMLSLPTTSSVVYAQNEDVSATEVGDGVGTAMRDLTRCKVGERYEGDGSGLLQSSCECRESRLRSSFSFCWRICRGADDRLRICRLLVWDLVLSFLTAL